MAALDAAVAEYRLFMLNAQPGVPDRDGVTLETPFAGPGMRGRKRLRYFPRRLSLVPVLLGSALPPDVALVHTSASAGGTVWLGNEVNILPAAIEAVRSRGGPSSIFFQVPSPDQRRCRLYMVFQFTNRSGRSRHGHPVRVRRKIPSITSQ